VVTARIIIYTIGHSNHSLDGLVTLLSRHGITRLVDVRSHPYSRWVPHFRKRPLAQGIIGAGIDYLFLGDSLGGRPAGDEFYRADGTVDYASRARAVDFQAGIEQLLVVASDRLTAIMCAEEDPARCHRRGLITPVLLERGLEVVHIRGDARLQPEVEERAPHGQLGLFS
jgi:uncharacterized protein (DUF488 family)